MKLILLLLSLILLCHFIRAQVPVSKEPRHHTVFENSKVRALNVLIPPGDTTQYHLHSTPSVFINFTKTNTGSQLLNQQPQKSTSVPGTIYFENLSAPNTRVHRVWNNDAAVFHVMDVELLGKDTGFAEAPLDLAYATLIVNLPCVRAYKTALPKMQTITVKQRASAFLIVAVNNTNGYIIENGTKKPITLQAGELFWIEPSSNFTIGNLDKEDANYALIEVH